MGLVMTENFLIKVYFCLLRLSVTFTSFCSLFSSLCFHLGEVDGCLGVEICLELGIGLFRVFVVNVW